MIPTLLIHQFEKDKQLQNAAIESILSQARQKKVNFLNISKNKFSNLDFSTLEPLENIKVVDCSYNQTELEKITISATVFPNLEHLYLYESKIKEIELIGRFPKLETLHLAKNSLSELTIDFDDFPVLETLYLYDNPFSSSDILSVLGSVGKYDPAYNCLSVVKERYERAEEEGVSNDNEIKVLLIGEGNVGKSCFVQRLVYNRFEEKWKSTHAISLEQFDKENKYCPELDFNLIYVLNLWDFGGQDIYHSTHRLFMQSQAIYLLFWDAETEKRDYTEIEELETERKYPVQRLPYWLSYASTQGEGSPVLVIQTKTKKQGKKTAPNQNDLLKEYKDTLQGFYHVESKNNDWEENGYNDILRHIQRQAKKVKKNSNILTSFREIREYVRSLQSEGNKTIELNHFLEYVENEKGYLPTNAITPTHVLNWLVQTGVVFYRKGLFEDKIILDQEWIILAIYTLFNRENPYSYRFIQENKGVISGKQLNQIWNKNSEGEKELFVSFMKSCELCFEITPQPKEEDRHKRVDFEERTFVVPQLLPNKKEDYFWDGRECLYVRYRQPFMHKGTIESFIFRTQEKYSTETIQLWNTGIRLKNGNEFAEVERINDQELQIRITPNAKDLLDKIRNLIDEIIHKEITELVSADGENFVSLNRLEKTDIYQNKTILSESEIPIEIEKLLIFLNQDKQNTFKMKQNDLHPIIQKAVKCLQNADCAGYFNTLDNISMPLSLEITYAAHKGKFINGKTDWDFPQQLIAFTDSLNKQINPSSNSTIMQDPKDDTKKEGTSDKGVTIIFNPNINNSSTNNNTNENKNSQSQQIDFKVYANTLEKLHEGLHYLNFDIDKKLKEGENKELVEAKKQIEETIKAVEETEIKAKEAEKGDEDAKGALKKNKFSMRYLLDETAKMVGSLVKFAISPENMENVQKSLETAKTIGGQLGL
jgi:GTPase SAR1 family protein